MMSKVKNINNGKEVNVDYLHGLAILEKSKRASRQKFMGVMGLFIVVFVVIFSVLPRLF